jgi:hypothetical protein
MSGGSLDHLEARVAAVGADDGYPVIGETTEGLGEYLLAEKKLKNLDGYHRVRRDALAIVRRSRRFAEPDGTRTGLVVGYVQSGKTMSMTTVSALARDNGCRIVVLLAGVTTNLLQQNAARFKTDLRKASGKNTAWRIFNSQDGLGPADVDSLRQAVDEWHDHKFAEVDRQTFLYLVLKNHAHLDKLYDLLHSVDLRRIPALIIDDEADQAGLNTSPEDDDGSTTYQRIRRIRSVLPHHTYLQYTATPQAPLLIALDDMLSPAFAELVEPGDGHTGGQTFFGVTASPELVRRIPDADLFKPGTPPDEPPESLLEAMRVFFVGCAIAALRGKPRPRSMLVHPSPRKADHARYLQWVRAIVARWTATLRSSDEAERSDTLAEMRGAYDDLATTAHLGEDKLPPFEQLEQRLQVSLGRVSLKEVNSQDGSEVDWENAEEHILVGGEKLNRGFTVEGLTVTYMPRDAGDWNADTIQQRARFFGYKAGYLALCRLYLHPDVIHAYRAYVRHEEDIRKQLAEHRGRPLREWRRAFFLDAKMRPTRRNVLSDPLYRIPRDQAWFVQRHSNLLEPDANVRNQAALASLRSRLVWEPHDAFPRHAVAETSLLELYRDVLISFETRGADVPRWYGQLVTLSDILDSRPDAPVVIVSMDNGSPRNRSIGDDKTVMPHQGRSSKRSGDAYPGDVAIFDSGVVTVQIHSIRITGTTAEDARDVSALAVHIPASMRRDDVLAQGV